MILRYALLSLAPLLAGVVIGEVHACGLVVFRDARERLLDALYDARRRLAVLFMRAGGEHADPRETGPLNVLPEHPRYGTLLNDTPPDGVQVDVQGETLTVGRHEHTAPRADAPYPAPDLYERFRQVLAGNGIMPGDLPRTEPLLRTLFAPAQAPAYPSPSMLPLTGPFPRVHAADLVYDEAPQLAVEQAQRLAERTIA